MVARSRCGARIDTHGNPNRSDRDHFEASAKDRVRRGPSDQRDIGENVNLRRAWRPGRALIKKGYVHEIDAFRQRCSKRNAGSPAPNILVTAIEAAVAIDAVVPSETSNLRMNERDNKAMLTSITMKRHRADVSTSVQLSI